MSIVEMPERKTDQQYADEVKLRIVAAHGELLKILNEARRAGFEIQYQVGPNAVAEIGLIYVKVAKVF